MALRFQHSIAGCCFSLALNRKTTPNSRQEGNQYCRNQYNTQYLAILLKSSPSYMTSMQVVQCKMSNLPLGLLLCVICATAPGWKCDAWAGQSRVRGEGLGKGLGIVSGQHCFGTLWQLDILPKGDIVSALGVT